jgi:LacI family transcriptional regulator
VLNQRPGVRGATAQKVLKAAAEMDYLPRRGCMRAGGAAHASDVLLPDGSNRFIRMLGDTVGYSQEHLTPFNVKCRTELFESFNPQQLAASLLQQGKRSEGIAFMALEHPAVREAVSELAEKACPPSR